MTIRAIFMLFVSRGGERGQGAQISQKYSVVVNIPTTTTTTSTTALPTTTVPFLENATVDEVRFVCYLLRTSLQQPSQNRTSLQIKFVKYENWEKLVLFFLSSVWLQVKVYFLRFFQYFIHTVSSAAPRIHWVAVGERWDRTVGPIGQLRLRHWLTDALTTRLDLIL